ncbi:hypothetical protein WDW37_17815 [Bdellovibrionota bacterium FG-1]
MKSKKSKPWATLAEDMVKIRRQPPDPKGIEKFNDLMKKDEELEKSAVIPFLLTRI